MGVSERWTSNSNLNILNQNCRKEVSCNYTATSLRLALILILLFKMFIETCKQVQIHLPLGICFQCKILYLSHPCAPFLRGVGEVWRCVDGVTMVLEKKKRGLHFSTPRGKEMLNFGLYLFLLPQKYVPTTRRKLTRIKDCMCNTCVKVRKDMLAQPVLSDGRQGWQGSGKCPIFCLQIIPLFSEA